MELIAATCKKCGQYTYCKDLEKEDSDGRWICKKCFKKILLTKEQ